MITFINKVEMCEAHHVHSSVNLRQQKALLTDYVPWVPLPTLDFSEMECSDDWGVQRTFSVRVRCTLTERIILPERPVVFRLTDIYNRQFLLGVPELAPPYPLAVQTDKAPAKPSEGGLCQLYISYNSTYPLLQLL